MMQRMSKKTVPLLSRPEPPNVKQIVEDIKNAEEDDIIFTYAKNEAGLLNSPTGSENYSFDESLAKSPAKDDSPSSRTGVATTEEDVNVVYSKAVELLELTDQLKSAPETLKYHCSKLEVLGQELKDSIEQLKTQSQVALNKSMNIK